MNQDITPGKIVVRMTETEPKKTTVRYDIPTGTALETMPNAYVKTHALIEAFQRIPTKIRITIEADE